MSGRDKPLVTVMVITYNHARFIAQCLDSILAQKTDFPVVVHVVDDCSTDGAQDIIRRYAAEHPGRIKAEINRRNIGSKVSQRNFHQGFKRLDGDYFAILEGDDYWTVPDKLQRQIDFLESHPDYVAAGHNVLKVYDGGEMEPHLFMPPPEPIKDGYDISDFIFLRSYFHTSGLTYRHVFRGKTPRAFRNRLSCDLFVIAAHAQFGKVHFDPEPMAVYRQHAGGLFSGMNPTQGWIFNIDGMRKYNAWLGFRHWRDYVEAIYLYCEYLLRNGTPEGGLTPWVQFKYGWLGEGYKRLHKWGVRRAAAKAETDQGAESAKVA